MERKDWLNQDWEGAELSVHNVRVRNFLVVDESNKQRSEKNNFKTMTFILKKKRAHIKFSECS